MKTPKASRTWIPALVVLLSSTFVAAAPGAGGASWPQFRGPNRDGLSSETGLLDKWPEGGPKLLWTAKGAGGGYSSVAIVGGRFYTMGAIGDDEFVFAYDLANGKQVWKQRNGARYDNDRGYGPRGTPTVEGDVLYALGANGNLSCRHLKNGEPVWQRDVLKEFGGSNISWGLSESVLVHGNKVICMPGGPDASIVAVNKKDGSTIWQSKGLSHRAGYSSAVPFGVGDVEGIAHFTHQALVGLDAKTGKTLWEFPRVANGTANAANPVVHGKHVFGTSNYGQGCGLVELSSDDKGGVAMKEVYFNKKMQNHHGGVVLVDGTIYGSTGNSGRGLKLVALDLLTGKELWNHKSVGKASLVYADGHLYCLSINGVMGLVEVNSKKYVEKSRFVFKDYNGKFKTGGIQPNDEKPTWTHPVIAGKKLFLRDQDRIFCYDIAAR